MESHLLLYPIGLLNFFCGTSFYSCSYMSTAATSYITPCNVKLFLWYVIMQYNTNQRQTLFTQASRLKYQLVLNSRV
jgi:hypothetical protein